MTLHIDQAAMVLVQARAYEMDANELFRTRYEDVSMPKSARNANMRAAARGEIESGAYSQLVARPEYREQGRVAMRVPSQDMTLVFRSRSSIPLQLPLDTGSDFQSVSDEIEHLLLFEFDRHQLELELVPAKKVVSDGRTKYHLQGFIEPLGTWSLLTGERLASSSSGERATFGSSTDEKSSAFEQDEGFDWIDFDELDESDEDPKA